MSGEMARKADSLSREREEEGQTKTMQRDYAIILCLQWGWIFGVRDCHLRNASYRHLKTGYLAKHFAARQLLVYSMRPWSWLSFSLAQFLFLLIRGRGYKWIGEKFLAFPLHKKHCELNLLKELFQ